MAAQPSESQRHAPTCHGLSPSPHLAAPGCSGCESNQRLGSVVLRRGESVPAPPHTTASTPRATLANWAAESVTSPFTFAHTYIKSTACCTLKGIVEPQFSCVVQGQLGRSRSDSHTPEPFDDNNSNNDDDDDDDDGDNYCKNTNDIESTQHAVRNLRSKKQKKTAARTAMTTTMATKTFPL
eukprot:359804-Chlamydomonas_euryale.AAC.4